ncbi:MAG: hypothetical protein P8Y70_00920 [Candidatus Lokiarchaeota archaeon]
MQNGESKNTKFIEESLRSNNGYQIVNPINITSWEDWSRYPFIKGEGNSLNPFIIENLEIVGKGIKTIQSGNKTLLNYLYAGIYINTNGSFIIQNCKISNTSVGIHLSISVTPGIYQISEVEIRGCSMGIYSYWPHVTLNISNCYIHDCNWISKMPRIYQTNYLECGGIGIWVRSNAGIIEGCRIEDCSIGMMVEQVADIHNNELINCGIVLGNSIPDYDNTNTINGKPLGLFWGLDNLIFTQSNASQYGQLIFVSCANLSLSNIHITESSSIGIQVFSLSLNQTTHLNSIICENQKLAMYIIGKYVIGKNLYAKNCVEGFCFNNINNCKFTRMMTDNTYIPFYINTPINNVTVEIERSTNFYLVDNIAGYGDKLLVESFDSSYNISMSYITELGTQGYNLQFNDLKKYQVSLLIPPYLKANFTVISVPRYARPGEPIAIPSYHMFYFCIAIIVGVFILIKSHRRSHRK